MIDQLKPCPFCGGAPTEYDQIGYSSVKCHPCKFSIKVRSQDGPPYAPELWNRRADAQAGQQEPATAQDDLVVYRAVNQFGSDCHFGVESLARVWAGPKGSVERVTLTPVPELSVVSTGPAQAGQHPPTGKKSLALRGKPFMWVRLENNCINDYTQDADLAEMWMAEDWPVTMPLHTLPQPSAETAALHAQIEEWSGTAVQNGMECDRLRAELLALVECASEGAGILQSLIDAIESKGNYSAEATVDFLRQALSCVLPAEFAAQENSHG